MSASDFFFSLDKLDKGISRQLTDAITAHIFPAEQSMASVVVIGPNAEGSIHSHPQEQWSILIEGSATRIHEGEHIAVSKGDFWVAPGNTEHGIIGGPEGAVIIDIFARHGLNIPSRVRFCGAVRWPLNASAVISATLIRPGLTPGVIFPLLLPETASTGSRSWPHGSSLLPVHAALWSGLYDQCFRR